MPNHNTISSKRLDRSYSAGAKQSLKPGQLSLAFQHEPHNLAFGRRVAASHRPERSRRRLRAETDSQTDALPVTG